MTVFEQILAKSRELFMKYGVKTLTMDDIAKELGMSKKTIYQYVHSKADLVLKSTKEYIKQETIILNKIQKESHTALEEMVKMIAYLSQHFKEFNTATFYDLKKHYIDSFEIVDEYRQKQVLKRIHQNLENGIKQGYYRANINADVVSKFYIASFDTLIDQHLFPAKKTSFYDIYKEYLHYHLHGILSEKGLKELQQSKLIDKI